MKTSVHVPKSKNGRIMLVNDFIALADVIRREQTQNARFSRVQLETLASFCASQNSNFKRDRWLGYITGENGPCGGKKSEMSTTPTSEPRCYKIIRFRRNSGTKRTVRNNVTLTEAQNHCSRKDTRGEGWFDGYDYMPGCRPKGAS